MLQEYRYRTPRPCMCDGRVSFNPGEGRVWYQYTHSTCQLTAHHGRPAPSGCCCEGQ